MPVSVISIDIVYDLAEVRSFVDRIIQARNYNQYIKGFPYGKQDNIIDFRPGIFCPFKEYLNDQIDYCG